MTPDGAGQGEGDDAHNDQRLDIGFQRDRQQRINHEQGEGEKWNQRADRLSLVSLCTFKPERDTWVRSHDVLDRTAAKIGQYLVRSDLGAVDISDDIHHPAVVSPSDG